MKVKVGDVLRNADDTPVRVERPASGPYQRQVVLPRECRFNLDGVDVTHLAIREADEEAGMLVIFEENENPTRFKRYKIENGAPVLRTLTGKVQITYEAAA